VTSGVEVELDCQQLLERWREMMSAARTDIEKLLWNREQIRRIARMIEGNPRLKGHPKQFLWSVLEWYSHYAAMTIRRQADIGRDVLSLRRVMLEMARHPDCLNREMMVAIVENYYGDGIDPEFKKQLVDDTWSQYGDEAGLFDVAALQGDLSELVALSEKAKAYATEQIAHTLEQALDNPTMVTYDELNSCIDAFDRIAVKYIGLLTGAGLTGGTLLPTEQYDWWDEFTFAWHLGS
jgi:hypothetical protein